MIKDQQAIVIERTSKAKRDRQAEEKDRSTPIQFKPRQDFPSRARIILRATESKGTFEDERYRS